MTDEMVENSINNTGSLGTTQDMWHPEYGCILEDGQLTEAGKEYFSAWKEKFKNEI